MGDERELLIMKQTDIRGFEDSLLKKVCNYEEKEPPLPSFTNERVERGVIDKKTKAATLINIIKSLKSLLLRSISRVVKIVSL